MHGDYMRLCDNIALSHKKKMREEKGREEKRGGQNRMEQNRPAYSCMTCNDESEVVLSRSLI